MRRTLTITLAALALGAALAFADPGVSLTWRDGVARVQLDGSYPGSWYRVWRSGQPLAGFESFTTDEVLCTGDCYAVDRDVVPGRTYWYRFDISGPAGATSLGPFAVTIPDTPLGARVWPNPGRGLTAIELSLPGAPRDGAVTAEARVHDLQGRVVRVLHSGPLARGTTRLAWDGRDARGASLGAGIYFLRFTSALGNSTTRIVRVN